MNARRNWMLALFALALAAAKSETLTEPATSEYAAVLKQYVDGRGMVDYKGLQANRQPLDRYVSSLAALAPPSYEKWTKEKKIAFWLNAYNGLTLRAIVDHYPIKKGGLISGLRFPNNSIRQIPGAWDQLRFTVMGRQMTLDQMEHEVLRKQFNEPRIHMALVCAAKGCPPLRDEPYAGDRLDAQLSDQARTSLSNPERLRIDRKKNSVHLSSIFKWFGADFAGKYTTDQFTQQPKDVRPVLAFVSHYAGPRDAGYLKTGKYYIEYLDYDWSLNEQARGTR